LTATLTNQFDVESIGDSDNDSHFKVLIKMWYFGLTTLSTIGYGDYSAKSS
jgi:hypothetical protein